MKNLKLEFAPGCFDDFEGTQEELDELINLITEKFSNMTEEELKLESVSVEDLDISEEMIHEMIDNDIKKNLH